MTKYILLTCTLLACATSACMMEQDDEDLGTYEEELSTTFVCDDEEMIPRTWEEECLYEVPGPEGTLYTVPGHTICTQTFLVPQKPKFGRVGEGVQCVPDTDADGVPIGEPDCLPCMPGPLY